MCCLTPSVIPLSTATLTQLATVLRVHRRSIGSRWRKLSAGRQALLVLAHLRNGDTYARLAAGFGVGVATVSRYVWEAVRLLAALAPSLVAALWRLCWSGSNFAVLDGTVVRINRLRARDRLFYAGKHKHHGVNLQGLIDPHGRLIWISDDLAGSVHDLTAARAHDVIALAEQAELVLLADKGYTGAGGSTVVPYKGRDLPEPYQQANQAHARVRGQGERGFATLKNWHILDHVRACPIRIGQLAKAILTLELGPES